MRKNMNLEKLLVVREREKLDSFHLAWLLFL